MGIKLHVRDTDQSPRRLEYTVGGALAGMAGVFFHNDRPGSSYGYFIWAK